MSWNRDRLGQGWRAGAWQDDYGKRSTRHCLKTRSYARQSVVSPRSGDRSYLGIRLFRQSLAGHCDEFVLLPGKVESLGDFFRSEVQDDLLT